MEGKVRRYLVPIYIYFFFVAYVTLEIEIKADDGNMILYQLGFSRRNLLMWIWGLASLNVQDRLVRNSGKS